MILGTILFGVIASTLAITVLTAWYSSQGIPQDIAMEKARLASNGFVFQVILSVLQLGFMLWLVRWLIKKVEKQEFDWVKLGLVPNNRANFIKLGTGLAVGLSLLTIGAGLIAGTLIYFGNGLELFGAGQVLLTLILAAVLAMASGFGEEIAFRGYLQSRITQRYNSKTAVVIVAVLFALSHPLDQGNNPLLYIATAILVGILLGTIFAITGSLWMGIALHTVWNYVQIAVLAIRNSPDERFFGAPLLIFESVSVTSQMLIEFSVIFSGLLIVFWLSRKRGFFTERCFQE